MSRGYCDNIQWGHLAGEGSGRDREGFPEEKKYLTETLRTELELNWAKRRVKSYKGEGRTSAKLRD